MAAEQPKTRSVFINGVGTIEVPADATDDEIRALAPQIRQALGVPEPTEAEATAPPTTAYERFGRAVAREVSAIPAGLVQAVQHPIETGRALASEAWNRLGASAAAYREAGERVRSGDPLGMIGKLIESAGQLGAAALPGTGPLAEEVARQGAGGDVAGAVGTVVGGLVPWTAGPAARSAKLAVLERVGPERMRQAGRSAVARAMTPTVGARKVPAGEIAKRAAPAVVETVVEQGAPWTHAGLLRTVDRVLDDIRAQLDTVAETAAHTGVDIDDVIDALVRKQRERQVEVPSARGRTFVTPEPAADYTNVIRQAIKSLQAMKNAGVGIVTADQLQTMRRQYYDAARASRLGAMERSQSLSTSDMRGRGYQAVDDAMREVIGEYLPQAKAINAQYAVYKGVRDVLDQLLRTERARPTVGRKLSYSILASVIGGKLFGDLAAAFGIGVGPASEWVASRVTAAYKTAAHLEKLARAVESGDRGAVTARTHAIRSILAGVQQEGRQQQQAGEALEQVVVPGSVESLVSPDRRTSKE